MRATSVLTLALALTAGAPAAATGLNDRLDAFLAGQGCAVGPGTRTRAADAGISLQAFDHRIAQAQRDADTVQTGTWVVLSPSLCTIRPPDVKSRIGLDDPETRAMTSAIDAHLEVGELGCFIDGPGLMARVQETRGWDADTATATAPGCRSPRLAVQARRSSP